MTDVNSSFLMVEGYYALDNDLAIPSNLYTAPVAGVMTTPSFLNCCIFNDVVIEVNGTMVHASQGLLQPYCMFASQAKYRSGADRQASRFTEGSIGTPGFGLTENYWKNFKTTQFMSATVAEAPARPFTLVLKLSDLGFRTNGAWLPPNVTINVRARRSSTAFLRAGTDLADPNDINPIFKLNKARFFMARKELDPLAKGALDMVWIERPIKVPFIGVRSQVFNYDSTATEAAIVGALAGPTPDTVFAIAVPTTSMQGTNESSDAMETSLPAGSYWENVSITVGGGRSYPIQSYSQVSSDRFTDLGQQFEMYRQACDHSGEPWLSSGLFSRQGVLAFQIGSRTDAWDAAEDVSITFNGRIAGNGYGVAWSIILVSFTSSLLKVAYSGHAAVTTA